MAGTLSVCSTSLSQAALSFTAVDAGGGNTTFNLSGSTVAIGGVNQNGFWFNDTDFDVYHTATVTGFQSAVFSDAVLFTTTSGATNVDSVYLDSTFALGFHSGMGGWADGDILTASGSVTIAVDYSFFENMSYNSTAIGSSSNGLTTTATTINAVPEPSSALLASAGLGLLAFRRKRK